MKNLNSKLFENNTIVKNKMAKVVGGAPQASKWESSSQCGCDTIDFESSNGWVTSGGQTCDFVVTQCMEVQVV